MQMQVEEGFERRRPRKVRVKVKTNRGLDFITAIKADATISDLANRALSVYMQLSEDGRVAGIKKQLTVSAVKQGIFYMPKSELVASLLNCDDEVEVVIIKAKPKYPNQLFQNQHLQPPIQKPVLSRPEPQLLVEPVENIQPKQPTVQIKEVIAEEDKEVTDKMSCVSKRQQKKEKKQEKQRLKQQARQKQIEAQKAAQKQTKQISLVQKSQVKNDQPSESKTFKEAESAQQGNPRKKLKFQKEQTVQKIPPLIVPSPKITFHNEPRLESPKFFLLNQASKKKWEGQMRKQSDEVEKRSQIQKMISPVIANKSPLIYQRSPNMALSESLKAKDKQELSNFTLNFRKLSEDKKMELKKEKPKDEIPSPRKEDMKNSLKKDEEKELTVIEPHQPAAQRPQSEKKQVEKRELPVTQKKAEPIKLKPTPSMVVVEQDDSDSQQNKKSNCPYVHHRQKQLTQIQQKINQFYIYSDEE